MKILDLTLYELNLANVFIAGARAMELKEHCKG